MYVVWRRRAQQLLWKPITYVSEVRPKVRY